MHTEKEGLPKEPKGELVIRTLGASAGNCCLSSQVTEPWSTKTNNPRFAREISKTSGAANIFPTEPTGKTSSVLAPYGLREGNPQHFPAKAPYFSVCVKPLWV